jgi:hypothetical protein
MKEVDKSKVDKQIGQDSPSSASPDGHCVETSDLARVCQPETLCICVEPRFGATMS